MYVCVQLHCESARSFILLLNIVAIKASNLNFPLKKTLLKVAPRVEKSYPSQCSAIEPFIRGQRSTTWQMTQFPADTPVTLSMCRRTVQRNARQRKSVLNGGFCTWADLTHKARAEDVQCHGGAPHSDEEGGWLRASTKLTNKLYLAKNKAYFSLRRSGAFPSDRSNETHTNTWMHTRWETSK